MSSNMSYIAAKLEEDRAMLEHSANVAYTVWDRRPQPADYENATQWREEFTCAMNNLGAALMPLGLGAGSRKGYYDPRQATPANKEAFTEDNWQRGPL